MVTLEPAQSAASAASSIEEFMREAACESGHCAIRMVHGVFLEWHERHCSGDGTPQ